MSALRSHRLLAANFLKRELESRYVGTGIGAYLALINPLLQLAVYTIVFSLVFKTQFAELNGKSFTFFLAVGLWPWLMFREGVGRATQAIVSNAALVGKIAFPRELLVYATVTASFLIHLAGFAVALTALAFFGDTFTVAGLPSWLLLLFGWYVLALALGLVFSAVQVYWRELEHLLDSLWMLVFYATPILFSLATLPESLRTWLAFNPLSYPVSRMREVLFHGKVLWATGDLVFVLTAVVLWWIARRIFLRLEERFDDAL